jgi:hypothetical protein
LLKSLSGCASNEKVQSIVRARPAPTAMKSAVAFAETFRHFFRTFMRAFSTSEMR